MKRRLSTLTFLLGWSILFSQSAPIVGLYPFQGDANDYSVTQNHGVAVGAVPCTDRFGSENAAYYFDGSAAVIIPDVPELRADHLSFSFWFQAHDSEVQPIFYKGNIVSGNFLDYRLDVEAEGLSLNFYDNQNCPSAGQEFGGSTLSNHNNCWTHIVLTKGEDVIKIYENGMIIHQAVIDEDFEYCGGESLSIGNSGTSAGDFFRGKVDDIRIYNAELPAEDILNIYQQEAPPAVNCDKDAECMGVATEDVSSNKFRITISPNPASNIIHVVSGDVKFRKYLIYNLGGRIMKQGNFTDMIETGDLKSGMYFLQVQDAHRVGLQRFVKLGHN